MVIHSANVVLHFLLKNYYIIFIAIALHLVLPLMNSLIYSIHE